MAFHSHSASLFTVNEFSSHVPMACNQHLIALPWTQKTIGIWQLHNVDGDLSSAAVSKETS